MQHTSIQRPLQAIQHSSTPSPPPTSTPHPLCTPGWDEGRNKYLLRELLIHQELSACHHPHIVELRDVFLTPTHLAAVAEYVEGEDLQTFLANTGGR